MPPSLPRVNNATFRLWCKLPTQRLCVSLADALSQNVKIKQVLQDAIAPYNRDDWGQQNLPALSIYYKTTKTIDNVSIYSGTLTLKFHVPLSVTRNRENEVGIILTEGTMLVLQDYPFFDGIAQINKGLRSLGSKINADFSNMEGIVNKDVFVLPMTIDFALDMLVWRSYIYDTVGSTALNPCVPIYGDFSSYEIYVYPSIFPPPP